LRPHARLHALHAPHHYTCTHAHLARSHRHLNDAHRRPRTARTAANGRWAPACFTCTCLRTAFPVFCHLPCDMALHLHPPLHGRHPAAHATSFVAWRAPPAGPAPPLGVWRVGTGCQHRTTGVGDVGLSPPHCYRALHTTLHHVSLPTALHRETRYHACTLPTYRLILSTVTATTCLTPVLLPDPTHLVEHTHCTY